MIEIIALIIAILALIISILAFTISLKNAVQINKAYELIDTLQGVALLSFKLNQANEVFKKDLNKMSYDESRNYPLSDYPEQDEDWSESEMVCPQCGEYRLWHAPWYDDPIESGGACIGDIWGCGSCGFFDTE